MRRSSDLDFCARMLPRVSRTFALSIEALPAELRDAVRVAYLLCRVVDTVEDSEQLSNEQRERLFDAFDLLAAADEADPRYFSEPSAELLAQDGVEGELCAGADAVLRSFRALPVAQREVIRPRVLEMSRGMREYTRHSYPRGRLRLDDMRDLERYCYFVAGTVGELLTDLFEQRVPLPDERTRREIRARAVDFGLGLQLVNIVKDVAEDHERGFCFLPERQAREHGLLLDAVLDPGQRAAGLRVVRQVCERARGYLERAREYVALWPLPEGAPVRLFCSVPLALALATLHEVEKGDDTLLPGRTPKVARDVVACVLTDAPGAATSDAALERMLGRWP